jgi:hypothetical protein
MSDATWSPATAQESSAWFAVGIAGRLAWRPSRIAILVTSAIALAVGIVNLVRLPVG